MRWDLTDRVATAEVLERVAASGRIDAVVNNVAVARFSRIGSINLDDLFVTYDLNVRTAVQVVQAVLPGMLAAGWGGIVNQHGRGRPHLYVIYDPPHVATD